MTDTERRSQKTKEEKRILAAEATRFAFEDTEKQRAINAAKTIRLRALRLAAQVPQPKSPEN